jgi:hypothetical protein
VPDTTHQTADARQPKTRWPGGGGEGRTWGAYCQSNAGGGEGENWTRVRVSRGRGQEEVCRGRRWAVLLLFSSREASRGRHHDGGRLLQRKRIPILWRPAGTRRCRKSRGLQHLRIRRIERRGEMAQVDAVQAAPVILEPGRDVCSRSRGTSFVGLVSWIQYRRSTVCTYCMRAERRRRGSLPTQDTNIKGKHFTCLPLPSPAAGEILSPSALSHTRVTSRTHLKHRH